MADPKSLKILKEMLALPTAPFAEHAVIDYLRSFCARRRSVKLVEDSAGNLLVSVRQGGVKAKRPVCITAHLDHPGFVADRMTRQGRLRAFWRGGVPPEYFVGARVRFHVDGRWVNGKIKSIKTVTRQGRRRVESASIEVSRPIPAHSVGMWHLPEPRVRGGRIHARCCDDIAGAAAMVSCIEELVRRRLGCDAYFLFTRAEEVGFIGAIAAVRLSTIPKKCIVVAMENSSELVDAKMGDGPILRVGDRASVFTPDVTAHCHRVARELAAKDKKFRFQRKLMDGGTCESSAYCCLGLEATGLCIALGNYHNVDTARKRIGPEYISLADYENVIRWFVALARGGTRYEGRDPILATQIADLERTHRSLLRRSVTSPR